MLIDYNRNPTPLPARAVVVAPDRQVEYLAPLGDGWFSKRVHGRLEPNRRTIVNRRDPIRRNKRVSIGGIVGKFKRFIQSSYPIPSKVS